jgi:hypothetical protein
MVINEGGLVSALNDSVGFSDWLISASFSSSLPGNAGKIPVKPFINVLYGGKAGKSDFYYEAGLKAGDTGLFEIYIPFFVSGNINNAWPTIRDRIRFVLNLSAFHPLRTAMGRTD